MKKIKLLLTLAIGLFITSLTTSALADDSQVTLTGTLVCAKCKLHETKECQNVLQVDKDGQTVNYYLTQNKVSKDFHPNICTTDGEKVTVTGTVKEKHGKEVLTPTDIEASK